MIIVELHGGLGNQMFQYALGRYLSILNKTDLKLDTIRFGIVEYPSPKSGSYNDAVITKPSVLRKNASRFKRKYTSLISQEHYHTDFKRIYELSNLSIVGKPLSLVDMAIFRLKHFEVVYETSQKYDEKISKTGKNVYLMGFWQSEKYFKSIRAELLREFQVSKPVNEENLAMLEKINNSNSVFIHVRRGDYVSEKIVNNTFAVCDKDYFTRSIEKINSQIEDPTYFIFSDDPDWASENIDTGKAAKFISRNPSERGYDDLRLMYKCKHAVISNSSFSWWGAWLNQNTDKIVIAPKRWFADDKMEAQATDIVPESWIRL